MTWLLSEQDGLVVNWSPTTQYPFFSLPPGNRTSFALSNLHLDPRGTGVGSCLSQLDDILLTTIIGP